MRATQVRSAFALDIAPGALQGTDRLVAAAISVIGRNDNQLSLSQSLSPYDTRFCDHASTTLSRLPMSIGAVLSPVVDQDQQESETVCDTLRAAPRSSLRPQFIKDKRGELRPRGYYIVPSSAACSGGFSRRRIVHNIHKICSTRSRIPLLNSSAAMRPCDRRL